MYLTSNRGQHLRQVPGTSDWIRVVKNATRVRKIGPNLWMSTKNSSAKEKWAVSFEVLQAATSYTISKGCYQDPRLSVFPKLHTLYWNWHDDGEWNFSLVPHLVSSALQSLEIIGNSDEEFLEGSDGCLRSARVTLRVILDRCPNLQSLVCAAPFDSDGWKDVLEELSSQIDTVRHLRTFRTGHSEAITPDAVHRLGRHPALRNVSFFLHVRGSIPFEPPSHSVFLSLRELDVSGTVIRMSQLLEAIGSPYLSLVDILFEDPCIPATRVRDFMVKLLRFKSTVRRVTLDAVSDEWVDNDLVTISDIQDYILRPILSFQHLVSITLGANLDVRLDDSNIEAMANAWPKLRHLRVCFLMTDDLEKPDVTLAGLLPLSEYCPDLREIALSVDMCRPSSEAHDHLDEVMRKEPRSAVERVVVEYWHGMDCDEEVMEEMVLFLIDMFPVHHFEFSALGADDDDGVPDSVTKQWEGFAALLEGHMAGDSDEDTE